MLKTDSNKSEIIKVKEQDSSYELALRFEKIRDSARDNLRKMKSCIAESSVRQAEQKQLKRV